MSNKLKTSITESDVEAIEFATQRIESALGVIEKQSVREPDDFGFVLENLKQFVTLGKNARRFYELNIAMLTKPGIYAAGTSIEKPVNVNIELLKERAQLLCENRPEYQTSSFKCLGDYEKCRDSEANNLVCAFLFVACIAERLIPLVGGK